jgi:hypothetical protein
VDLHRQAAAERARAAGFMPIVTDVVEPGQNDTTSGRCGRTCRRSCAPWPPGPRSGAGRVRASASSTSTARDLDLEVGLHLQRDRILVLDPITFALYLPPIERFESLPRSVN